MYPPYTHVRTFKGQARTGNFCNLLSKVESIKMSSFGERKCVLYIDFFFIVSLLQSVLYIEVFCIYITECPLSEVPLYAYCYIHTSAITLKCYIYIGSY